MKNCAQKFLEILKDDEELRKKVENSKSTEETKKIVSPYLNGCPFEEFQKQLKKIESSLSKEELTNVAGGKGDNKGVGWNLGKFVGRYIGKLLFKNQKDEDAKAFRKKISGYGEKLTGNFCDKLKF
ncbi:MAG: hypothetical protein LBT82_03340 [Oscillospiraceae bacterium]|jgi:hypothetical protein|nr:hypothetical protein [Oscillospiraceae bacterium]